MKGKVTEACLHSLEYDSHKCTCITLHLFKINIKPCNHKVPILLYFQIIITLVTGIVSPPMAVLIMPVSIKQYVELVCEMPLSGFILCLSYNIILILCCAVFGFLTRKLPENFNESWYIFVSVSTTTFLWMVFLPAYFTAFYAYYQVVLLSSCLFLNATVTLLCLYVPKVYAIYFVDENKLVYVTGVSTMPTQTTGSQSAPN